MSRRRRTLVTRRRLMGAWERRLLGEKRKSGGEDRPPGKEVSKRPEINVVYSKNREWRYFGIIGKLRSRISDVKLALKSEQTIVGNETNVAYLC